jgi:hypothetical protein
MEHVISMATTYKTAIQCKLLSVHEKVNIINTADAT